MKDFPEFDWDEHNERHLAKHHITRFDAEDVLAGNHILLQYQGGNNYGQSKNEASRHSQVWQ